jgi:cation diffusion facilitator family transporter
MSTDAHDHGHDHGAHGHDLEHGHSHGGHDHEGHEHRHATGLKGVILGIFAPHSHDAADSLDTALESSRRGIRAVKISFVALLITSLLQLGVILISGSIALVADAIHNFSDALTAIPLFIAFRLARRPPTRRYTYGFGRAEDLAGMFVILMITLSAIIAAVEAIHRLVTPQTINHLGLVAAAGVIGFLGNELVALYRIREGNAIGSGALVADGYHARTDGFTSLAVVAGAVGVWAGFARADAIAGLVISIAIIAVLRVAVVEVFRRLMNGVDPELVDRIEHAATHVPGVASVGDVRVRWEGHRLLADLAVTVDDAISVGDAHEIAHAVEHELIHRVPHLDGATVHVEPDGPFRDEVHAAHDHHSEREGAAPPKTDHGGATH